jgi:hypothetical protein
MCITCIIYYKSPNIVYRANNVLVDAQLSTQYFNKKLYRAKARNIVNPDEKHNMHKYHCHYTQVLNQ